MKYAISCGLFALLVSFVSGYSGGAPLEVCGDMKPKHPHEPKESPFPYSVTIDKTEVKAGDKVQIAILGGKEDKTFLGFFVQVRNGDKAVGTFDISGEDKYAKAIDCNDNEKSAATHKNSTPKKIQLLDWIAPKDFQGKLVVYVTVAKDGATYWVRHKVGEINVI